MDIKYDRKEIEAIDKKMNNPSSVVICPRCGSELAYKRVLTSSEVKCPTNGCIKGTLRGI